MPDGMITARVFIEPYPLKNIVGAPFQGDAYSGDARCVDFLVAMLFRYKH